jgi:hypothetical protein
MVDQYTRVGQSLNAVTSYLQTSNASKDVGKGDLGRPAIRGVPLGRQSNRPQSEKLVVAIDIDEGMDSASVFIFQDFLISF